MQARTITAAAAIAATLTLAACTEDGPSAVSAVPEPEPGDPTIYAPDGWPLQVGDAVSFRRERELGAEFPGLGNVFAIHVVNGRTYGARFGLGDGFLPDEDFSDSQMARWRDAGYPGDHLVYEGHFPETVNDRYWQYERDRLPEHLHGRIEYHEDVKRLPIPRQQRAWEEQRARMRAEGLLPTSAQRSPGRKR
jgi:hypothetical protein